MKSQKLKFVLSLSIALLIVGLINAQKIAKSTNSMTPPGNALAFDGVNDVVNIGNDAKVQLTDGTIEAWVKTPNPGDGWRGIVVKHRAYGIFTENNQLIAFQWGAQSNSSIYSGVNINDNKWHHIAYSFSTGANNCNLYVDGVKKATTTFTMVNQNTSLGIGNGSITDNIQYFNGLIDEVRVWNTSRTEIEIQGNMYNELVGNESGLVAYYNMNQGTAGGDNTAITSLTDKTSNALNGVLNNFSNSGTTSNFVESYAMVMPRNPQSSEITDTGFKLTWEAPLSGSFSSYKLDISTSSNFSSYVAGYQNLDCGTNLTQTITGLNPYTQYYVRLRAENSNFANQGGGATITVKTLVDSQEYGNDSWIGYVYTNTTWDGNNPTFTGAVLKGTITETANFSHNWGGSGPVFNSVTYNDCFLIRFKMKKYFERGRYNISLSGDDGFRLIINNGNYQCMDWSIHGSSTRSMLINITEAGYKYLDMEFYEHGGGAWVTFNTEKVCDPPFNPKDIVITNNLTSTTASWNANGNATDVTYDWVLVGDKNDSKSGTTSQTNVNLNSLDENQNYTFYVSAKKTCNSEQIASNSFKHKYLKLKTTKKYLSNTSITCGGLIEPQGNETITERGVCWNKSPNPTTGNNKKTADNSTNSFETIVDNLTGNDVYYFRAYIIVGSETIYGNEVYFLPGCNVQTDVISIASNLSVISGGNIIVPEGIQVAERGICWSTSSMPVITDAHSNDGTGVGEFASSLSGLQNNTKYYVRAFAKINDIIFYGDEYSFTQKFGDYKFSGGWYFDGETVSGEYFEFDGSCWSFIGMIFSCDGGNPPLTGWDDGSELIPIITPKPTITYDKISLKEAACNDGSIKETLSITHDNLDGAAFTGTNNEDFVVTGKAIVRNLPAGLTAKIVRNNNLSLTLSITGKATAHVNANDVSNVKIMFVPDAFTDGSTTITNGNISTISLDFIEPVDMTITGTKTCADVTITADNNVTLDNNSTLTINSVTSANQFTLNPGAKLNLSNSVTVGDVILKADDSNSFSAKLSTCMTVNGTLTFEKTMLDSKWYFLSFPCDVDVTDISMVGGGTLETDFYILTYDGANRATNGLGVNWSHITSGTLEAKKGYAFGLKTGIGTKTLSFLLNKTIAECENEATVPATFYDGSLGNNHKGWNLIGQPYLSKFAGSDVGINYITTWNGSAYVGRANSLVGSLNPFEAFFVQVAATSPISFSLDGRQSARSVVNQNIQESIQLNMANAGGIDFSTLIFDNEQSSDYEIGYDLEKWITTGAEKPQIYSQLNGIKYSYNALPISSAINLPIGYYSKTGGASTISANNVTVAGLSKLLLVDNKTGRLADLMNETYSFDADAGTNNSRFSIIPQRISTNLPEKLAGNKPYAFVSNSKLTISNLTANATIRLYDATGKVLHVATTNGNNSYEIALKSAGMYVLQIDSNTGSWNYKLAAN